MLSPLFLFGCRNLQEQMLEHSLRKRSANAPVLQCLSPTSSKFDPEKLSMQRNNHEAYVFTLRLWTEKLGEEDIEWRGQVQHVMSRESYYFRDWETLLALLEKILPYRAAHEHEKGVQA